MRKFKIQSLILLMLILISCSSGFSRTGYDVKNLPKIKPENCRFSIKFHANFDENEVICLGKIKAYDTQFSIECDEAYVLSKFAEEACMLDADVINILEEKYPNFWSTCYRAKAEFLVYKDRNRAESDYSDQKYTLEKILERSKETARRNKMVTEAGVMGGLFGGLLAK